MKKRNVQAGGEITQVHPQQAAAASHRLAPSRRRTLAKLARRTDVLQRAVQAQTKPSTTPTRRRWLPQLSRQQWILGVIIVLILGLTGYVSIDAWLTNRRLQNQTQAEVDTSASLQAQEAAHQQDNEGRDEREIAPSLLSSYQTAADQPRALYINSLDVEARLLPMGVNSDGSMQAPYNIYDAGWYTNSAKPSRAGAVVIDAHASGPTREGLFAYLDTMKKGDMIEVETGDGTRYSYRVVATETVDLATVDMQKLMLPHGNATHGANFITCAGDWLQDSETFNEREIVYTELVS